MALILLGWTGAAGQAQSFHSIGCPGGHPTGDAWFTGPIIANNAANLPRGHALVESYFYDSTVQGAFDSGGARHSAPHANNFGTLTYIEYAPTDRMELGLLPAAGYNQSSAASGGGIGDWTMQAQRQLTHAEPCMGLPTVSVAVQQTLPTGRHDRLGDHPAAGQGSGAYSTNFALFSQTWFWLPNRRIVRVRMNAGESVSRGVSIRDVSVYGTAQGFRGSASPGRSLCLDLAAELSLTRRWVVAADIIYHASANTRVSGANWRAAGGEPIKVLMNSGTSDSWAIAPAVEHLWKSNLGVIAGARIIAAGRNTSATIMPVIGLSFVL